MSKNDITDAQKAVGEKCRNQGLKSLTLADMETMFGKEATAETIKRVNADRATGLATPSSK